MSLSISSSNKSHYFFSLPKEVSDKILLEAANLYFQKLNLETAIEMPRKRNLLILNQYIHLRSISPFLGC